MYRILDCLSGEEIAIETDYTKAHDIAKIHGGVDNCITVEPFEYPVSKPVEIVHNVPRRGERF